MQKIMDVTFPGNKRVDVSWGEMTVNTDQLKRFGGDETSPQPFDLFFASLASCAGISALAYCTARDLPTEGLAVRLIATRPDGQRRYTRVRIEVTPPVGFPEARVQELLAEAGDCTVKRHVLDPPAFETVRV